MRKALAATALALLLSLTACGGYQPDNAALSRPIPQRDAASIVPPQASSASSASSAASSQSEAASSSPAQEEYDDDIHYIGEKFFATQMNDVFLNPEDYMDKFLRFEGMYFEEDEADPVLGDVFRMVFRYTSGGCCGNDGIAGIELIGNVTWPENGEWVEVTCFPEWVDYGLPNELLRLHVVSFRDVEQRGAEYVPD